MQEMLDQIFKNGQIKTRGGRVATYIPELGKANPDDLGIVLTDINGKSYKSGLHDKKFTIQSVSKPLSLMLALMDIGEDAVFSKVGMEPTGDPFNSIIRLETFTKGKPLNPMINAGAITVSSLIKGIDGDVKIDRLLQLVRKLARNNNISISQEVYESEKETGNRNRSMAYFLKDTGIIEGDVEEVLDVYFKQCAIEITCEDLANIGCVLANKGVDPLTNEEIVPSRITRIAKTLMVTCGMYDESGEYAVNVGIPSKSGVGGGIICVVPNRFGIGVYGPALDHKGNSIAGVSMLKELSETLDLSIY